MEELCRRELFGMSRKPQGAPQDWQLLNMPSDWKAVVYSSSLGTGTGLWLIVGSNNFIATSSDTGATWTSRSSGYSSALWYDGCWTGSQFVIVGSGGSIATSSDGISWTAQTSGTSNDIKSIAYGGSAYVAVSSYDIYTSSNATSWTTTSLPGGVDILYGVDYVNSKFIATGRNDVIESSDSGATWTQNLVGLDAATVAYSSTLSLHVMMGNSGLTGSNLHYYTSTDGVSWTIRNTSAASGSVVIYDVKWHATDAIFVAVGSGGTIITSTNGTTWTARTSGTSSELRCSCYNSTSGDIVIVGAVDVLSSTTGVTWTAQTAPGVAIYGITWNSSYSVFVLVGASGAIYTSSNLSSYTSQTSGTSFTFYDVYHNGSITCAVGAGGIFTSVDGVSWSAIETTYDYYKVTNANSRWYAVGVSRLQTSTNSDASSWSSTTIPAGGGSINYYGICWNGTTFVATGDGATAISAATTTWTTRFNVDYLYSTVYASSLTKYVTSPRGGILYSTDALTWTMGYAAGNSSFSLVWTGSTLIASNNYVFTSTNATSWSQQTVDASVLYSGYSSSGVVGVGAGGQISTANTSGASWTPKITTGYRRIAKGGSNYVIGTANYGMMCYSTDRVNWTLVNTTATGEITKIIWDGTNFVAVTNASEVLYSTTGASWTVASISVVSSPISIAWSGSAYSLVTDSGYSYKSTNKTTWTDIQTLDNNAANVIWSSTHSLFVLVGATGYVATSPDAITWTTRTSNTTTDLAAVVWCAELSLFVAVGNSRVVITSPDATTAWTVRTNTSLPATNLTSVAWSGTRLLAGSTSYTHTSSDAINWEHQTNSPTFSQKDELIYDGTRFIGFNAAGSGQNSLSETGPH